MTEDEHTAAVEAMAIKAEKYKGLIAVVMLTAIEKGELHSCLGALIDLLTDGLSRLPAEVRRSVYFGIGEMLKEKAREGAEGAPK